MAELQRFDLSGGGSLLIDTVSKPSSGPEPASRAGRAVEDAKKTFEASLGDISRISSMVLESLTNLEVSPKEVEVQFGISFSAEADLVLVSGTAEANLAITLKWAE
jgi:hypothetical protein